MIRRTFLIITTLLLISILAPTAAARPPLQENLLRNPGFEGNYFAWNGIPEVQVAHDWTPWWIEDTNRDPWWHRPEWKRAVGAHFGNRVRSGDSAQQWFSFYASHYAGMYQQVSGVVPGQTYRFSIWVQVWSSLEDDAYTSVLPANPHFQIGIDPTGAARPGWASPPSSIVWSGDVPMDQAIDKWAYMSIDVVAQSETITVYMRSNPDFNNKHNDMYVDEASLIRVSDAPPPPPPPTATSAPVAAVPTAIPATATTEAPTATAMATATAAATVTTAPPTATTEPTATDLPPTATATELPPTATATPSPTATEVPPTATSSPSSTPLPPTETTEPTVTADPTGFPPTEVAAASSGDDNNDRTSTPGATADAVANNAPVLDAPDEVVEDGSSAAGTDNVSRLVIPLLVTIIGLLMIVALVLFLLWRRSARE